MNPKKAYPKKYVLDAFEQQIEDEIERGEWKPLSPQRREEIIEAAKRPPIVHRGGARPGAGRKPTGKKTRRKGVYLNILPETVKALEAAAGGRRGMGAVGQETTPGLHGFFLCPLPVRRKTTYTSCTPRACQSIILLKQTKRKLIRYLLSETPL